MPKKRCLGSSQEAIDFLIAAEGAQRVLLGTNFAGWDQEDGSLDERLAHF